MSELTDSDRGFGREASLVRAAAGEPPAEEDVRRVASEALDRHAAGRAPRRRRTLTWALAGGAAATAVLVAALLLNGSMGTSDAYAAVQAAAEKTAAMGSGTIIVDFDPGTGASAPAPAVITWSGDTYSVGGATVGGPGGGGSSGPLPDDGAPVPATELPSQPSGPSGRIGIVIGTTGVAGGAAAMSPKTLTRVLAVLDDVGKSGGEGGATVYSGTSTAAAISEAMGDDSPLSSPTFADCPPDTTVQVEVVVDASGIVTAWSFAFETDGHQAVFQTEYRDLGTLEGTASAQPAVQPAD